MSRSYKICVTTLLVLLSRELHTISAVENRIVGGRTTTIESAKYVVSLRERGQIFCGGSLVGDRYVVTAAHCVDGIKYSSIIVHGGATYLWEEGITRTVVRMIIPRGYDTITLTKDVAVLKLNEPMTGENVGTIPLCTTRLPVASWVQVFGWGKVWENDNRPSNQLRVVNLRMIGHKKCDQNYGSALKITKTMMCAAIPGERDSCHGDSGGPLYYRGQLCGIVSFGIGCARRQYPGVYTSINAVKRFIERAMEI